MLCGMGGWFSIVSSHGIPIWSQYESELRSVQIENGKLEDRGSSRIEATRLEQQLIIW